MKGGCEERWVRERGVTNETRKRERWRKRGSVRRWVVGEGSCLGWVRCVYANGGQPFGAALLLVLGMPRVHLWVRPVRRVCANDVALAMQQVGGRTGNAHPTTPVRPHTGTPSFILSPPHLSRPFPIRTRFSFPPPSPHARRTALPSHVFHPRTLARSSSSSLCTLYMWAR